jgi:ribose/xylose/arabinose/galactoside ABC-type transport system permease subunit
MTAITRPKVATADVGDGGLRLVLRAIRVRPALILFVLGLILTRVTPFFLTGDKLTNLLVQGAPLAVGQLFVILVGGIDLSVGSLIALTTVTGSLAFQHLGGGGARRWPAHGRSPSAGASSSSTSRPQPWGCGSRATCCA